VKVVQPSDRIRSKFAVFQDPKTGEIEVTGDYRWLPKGEMVVGFTNFYPHRFESPFAAYLLPQDLRAGEEVWLEDLIEDLVAAEWSQGSVYRLAEAPAIWNGNDFEIQFNPRRDAGYMIG